MKNYKELFRGKKITVMGLGILGRGLGYTKFLAECGAELIVTDLKTEEQLANSVKALSKFTHSTTLRAGKIKFVLGEHRLEDFRNRDMIIKAAGVPMDSIYIEEAKKNNIPIEMDVSLFAKCAPEVKIVGVTGTRGKSMTTTIIYEILSKCIKDRNVHIGGNIRGVATLPLLKKVSSTSLGTSKAHDILVCELDSWQLQGFSDSKISPNISVFTSFMPDHMNYYKNSMEDYFADKAGIYKNQTKKDTLIIRPDMRKLISKKDVTGKLVVVNTKEVDSWKFNVPGSHQRENLACAVEVAKQFKIPITKIKKVVKDFKGVEGRLQLFRVCNGVKIYNDNNATTPEATIAGLEALTQPEVRLRASPKSDFGPKIILICGGSDKKLDLTNFVKAVNKSCKFVSLIPGTGTDILLKDYDLKVPNEVGAHLKQVVDNAVKNAKKGDIILFSPAFASFGMFNNEYERNDLFMKIIKKLK